MRFIITLLLLPCTVVFVTGCAGDKKIPAGISVHRAEPSEEFFAGPWNPADVHLECQGPHCRPQVGVLIAARPAGPNRTQFFRCTASLVGPDRVLTNEHCALAGYETWFFLPSGYRRVANVIWKTQKSPVKLSPDLAVLKLERAFETVTPLRVARGATPSLRQLTALVVNAESKALHFRLDELTCAVRRHGQYFPFDLAENPDLIFGFDCRVVKGNSGGPLFGPGDEIQAVMQGMAQPKPNAKSPESPASMRDIGIATNVLCFAFEDRKPADCLNVNEDSIKSRAEATQKADWAALLDVGNAERANFQTEVTSVRQRLRQRVEGHDTLNVLDFPSCVRRGVDPLTEVKLLDQVVVLELDQWGRARAKLVARQSHVGRVISRRDDTYRIEMKWLPPLSELEDPAQHPSNRYKTTFDVELPRCAR